MTAALAQAGQWRGIAPVLDAEGRHIELEWSVSTHTLPDVRLVIVTDITERMAIEAERERLLRDRAASESGRRIRQPRQRRILAALSHELRTPLNAIVGFSRVLHMLPVITADTEATKAVDAIERNAWVQAQLISDLLDISRITSGKLEPKPMSPAEAVQAALTSIQSTARAKRIVIRPALDTAISPILWGPSRFQQVVWNLVDNAVKFFITAVSSTSGCSKRRRRSNSKCATRGAASPPSSCRMSSIATVRKTPPHAATTAARTWPGDRSPTGRGARRNRVGSERRRGSRRDLPVTLPRNSGEELTGTDAQSGGGGASDARRPQRPGRRRQR